MASVVVVIRRFSRKRECPRKGSFRDVHCFRRGHAGDGPLRQLSYRAGARHVAQRLLHIFRLPRHAHSLADGARRRIFSGVLFILLTVSGIREQIVNGIPDSLKHSTAAGIGMFIAFVGLKNTKIVVANPPRW